jgi:hypothetical protein
MTDIDALIKRLIEFDPGCQCLDDDCSHAALTHEAAAVLKQQQDKLVVTGSGWSECSRCCARLQDRAEKAEAEVKQATDLWNGWSRKCAEAEAERDALRADAERYRWLRVKRKAGPETGKPWGWLSVSQAFGTWGQHLYDAELDAAIDAARGSEYK